MFLLSICLCTNRVRQLSFMFLVSILVSIRICMMNRLRQVPLCVLQIFSTPLYSFMCKPCTSGSSCVLQRFLCVLFFHEIEVSENSQVRRMFLLSIRLCTNRVRQLSFMFLVSILLCMNRLRQVPLCVL